MKTSESIAVPEFNIYTIKARLTYDQIQKNYSAISDDIDSVSDTLINSILSLNRLDISNLLSTKKKVRTADTGGCQGFFFGLSPPEDRERSPPMPKASAGEARNPLIPVNSPPSPLLPSLTLNPSPGGRGT
jgi:hypothetical protein